MHTQKILILHPGAMGSAVASRLRDNGHDIYWLPAGRSRDTQERARQAGLQAFESLTEGVAQCAVVVSICPPHAALSLAAEVAQQGFTGHYIDANAVAPQTSAQVAEIVSAAGASYTDGGIIGPPPADSRKARLYLSGPEAAKLAPLFDTPALTAIALDGGEYSASALKMCFAGWNKARTALLLNLRALAAEHEVDDALLAEWAQMDPAVVRLFDSGSVNSNALKAWRWSAEMTEIATTFEAAGLPGDFHHGAAEVFQRLEAFKDEKQAPALAALTDSLRRGK